MAMTDPLTYEVAASFIDKENQVGSASWRYDSAELLVDVIVDAKEVAAAMGNISNAVLKRISISYTLEDPAVDYTGANEASEVNRKARAIFLDEDGEPVSVDVPSPPGSLVVDGSDVLDPTNSNVVAFIAKMLNTGATPGIGPVSRTVKALVKLSRPIYKYHRKTKRG